MGQTRGLVQPSQDVVLFCPWKQNEWVIWFHYLKAASSPQRGEVWACGCFTPLYFQTSGFMTSFYLQPTLLCFHWAWCLGEEFGLNRNWFKLKNHVWKVPQVEFKPLPSRIPYRTCLLNEWRILIIRTNTWNNPVEKQSVGYLQVY